MNIFHTFRHGKSLGFLPVLLTALILSPLAMISCAAEEMPVGQSQSISAAVPDEAVTPTLNIINPDSEIRGVWIASVANINYPSQKGLPASQLKAEIDDIIANVREAGMNAIFFQVRPAADALYKSEIFPTSVYLSGENGKPADGNFDPLAYLIEKAHAQNIFVHAWVNPLRVTAGSAAYPQHDLSALSDSSPAKNEDFVIPYPDGKLYFDAGIPEVRKLIADGVAEIARNYNVDGIVFDDYFYPYPVNVETGGVKKTAEFDDSDSYEKYGIENFPDRADWRRNNINQLVELCYKSIKAENEFCRFGIAPFGIYQNDNGSNGGSHTKGLESYSAIYCDTLAWVKGGYIDYIAPQIYWRFSTSAAKYDTLTRWWNQQLENTGVDLLISHAAYRYSDWDNPGGEMSQQLEFARSELTYKGSIMYGYDAIKNNVSGIKDELAEAYSKEIYYTDAVSNGIDVSVSTPPSGTIVESENTYIMGSSDPAYPLYMNGETVGRTKGGYFSIYTALAEGENKFDFVQNGKQYTYVIYRNYKPADAEPSNPSGSEKNEDSENSGKAPGPDKNTVNGFKIVKVTPMYDIFRQEKCEIPLTCTAPAGCTVTAQIGSQIFTLQQEDKSIKYNCENEIYDTALYSYVVKIPKGKDGEVTDHGNIQFQLSYGDKKDTASGAKIRMGGKDSYIPVITTDDDAELKVAVNSWYYDDFSVQAENMTDYAVWQGNGKYLLRVGGYVYLSETDELPIGTEIPVADIKSASVKNTDKYTELWFQVNENIPHNGTVVGDKFILTLYNVNQDNPPQMNMEENPIVKSVSVSDSKKKNTVIYTCELKDDMNFYGFDFRYEDGFAVAMLRNPQTLSGNAEKPLEGKTIVLDAGHGGSDSGALGALRTDEIVMDEADMNLAVVLAAKPKIEALGAKVILIRDKDETVNIYDRLDSLIEIEPDLSISVHQNSLPYNSDVTKIRGTIGLYYAESGKLLTDCIAGEVADSLNRFERHYARQRLAICRNPKFPSTLIEVGFITNIEEYDLMVRGDGIERAAEGIKNGILKYFEVQADWIG